MRISDWSSDVCSSDLVGQAGAVVLRQADKDVVILVIRRPPGAGLLAGQQRAQCIGDGGEAEAEVGGELAVDVDRYRRLVGLQARFKVDHAGHGADALRRLARQAVEFGDVLALERSGKSVV